MRVSLTSAGAAQASAVQVPLGDAAKGMRGMRRRAISRAPLW